MTRIVAVWFNPIIAIRLFAMIGLTDNQKHAQHHQ